MMMANTRRDRAERHGSGRGARRSTRRGSLLAELAISGALLMVAMALTVKVLGWIGAERHNFDRRQCALHEAGNLMERLTSRSFDAVTGAAVKQVALSPQAKKALPGADLQVDVVENDRAGGPGSKRVALQIRWRSRSGEWDSPVRLTSWIYRGRPDR